jgi:hypothetical protein
MRAGGLVEYKDFSKKSEDEEMSSASKLDMKMRIEGTGAQNGPR